jgi:hypothetical protein
MKKQLSMKEARVIPRGLVPLANSEAASIGTASLALNVREREQSLQVTGSPVQDGTIPAGDRLLLLSGSHRVTCVSRTVRIDGHSVATVTGDIVGAQAIGDVIVITHSDGFTYLKLVGGTWTVLDPAAAVPQLTLSANVSTSSVMLPAYTFETPYSQWRAPLSDADTANLSSILRTAWNGLHADAVAEGRYCAPTLLRWAVRLQDDSYLWMSDPVRVGDVTLANADRVTALVTSSGGAFTGIESTSLPMAHYRVGVDVTHGIAAEWLPLVKSIDVLATDEAQLLSASQQLDYRCLTRTTGGREHVLEMGLTRRGADTITRQLYASSWHLIARAEASATLAGADFVEPGEAMTMTNAQCCAIGGMGRVNHVTAVTSFGGRLYCCTRGGDVVVSRPGNAFVEAHRRSVLGTVPLALAVVTRPLYSSGFGRYPVYVFGDDGIYAIPQSATGTLGEARLLDRTVIADEVSPVEGGGAVWFVSRHGHLCRLSGSRVELCVTDIAPRALAWCDAQRELWMLTATDTLVLMAGGAMSRRSVEASQLYSDARHAVAVTEAGGVLDLEREASGMQPVTWHSHPVALHPLMSCAVHRVVWHLVSDAADLSLKVTGQRGILCQDRDVSIMTVNGKIEQPLASSTMAVKARTLRFAVEGQAMSGTLLLPTLVYSSPTQSHGHGKHII